MASELNALLARFPRTGRLEWIGLRPARREPVTPVQRARALAGRGLEGDHVTASASKRHITLIQWEHLDVIARFAGKDSVDPALLRRNLAVSGINLLALRRATFRIGEVVLAGTGACAPCSRMEAALGEGGLNAMRGHGGITARIEESGSIAVGDAVCILQRGPDSEED
jgi:MOSC domain-containing protein YiiM